VTRLVELAAYYLHGASYSAAFFHHFDPRTLQYVQVYGDGVALLLVVMAALCANELVAWRAASRWHRDAASSGLRALLGRLTLPCLAVALLAAPWGTEGVLLSGLIRARSGAELSTQLSDEQSALLRSAGIRAESLLKTKDDEEPLAQGDEKNLIFVYLESLEQQFFDESRYPGLLPFLSAQRRDGIDFVNARQDRGASFTVAAMFASQCALPFGVLAVEQSNTTLGSASTRSIRCLGDVLRRAGYRQAFMQGSSLDFAGTGEMFADHGFDEVLGLENLRGQGLVEGPRESPWGYSDRQLFAAAATKLSELAKTPPFNLTLATMDTHHPGSPSRGCPVWPGGDDSLLQAAHCTDYLLAGFFDAAAREGLLERTVVVFMSDHLSMHHAYRDAPDRKLSFFVTSAREGRKVAAPTGQLDVAPTMLGLVGVTADVPWALGRDALAADAAPPQSSRQLQAALRSALAVAIRPRLGCGSRVTLDRPRSRVIIDGRPVDLVDAIGTPGWKRGDFIALRGRAGRLSHAVTLPLAEAASLVDKPLDADTLILIGELSRLAPALSGGVEWGYFIRRGAARPVQASSLPHGDVETFAVDCED
jgi:arylsulfatase A-like enzyme